MDNISYNSYGEIRNLNDYKLLQKIYYDRKNRSTLMSMYVPIA